VYGIKAASALKVVKLKADLRTIGLGLFAFSHSMLNKKPFALFWLPAYCQTPQFC
jgi:hypothetical protein